MTILLVILIVILVALLIAGVYAFSAFLLMWAWNTVALAAGWSFTFTFWPALAAVVLLSFIGGVFNRTTVVKQKD